MIIIYGRRSYGRVESTEHEYARTRFAHIYFMPLIPTDSTWMTGPDTGIPIPMHAKSVAATYLRWWALPIAIAALASGSLVVGLPIGAALIALWGYQWTWYRVRGHERMRRDFNRLAFGTRCEPRYLDPAQRLRLEQNLRARWDHLNPGRSPNEVATFGAKSPGEAVVAYGLLRLASLTHPGGDEAECAERILRGTHETPTDEAGPYREASPIAAAVDVHAQVANAAAASDASRDRDRTYASSQARRQAALRVHRGSKARRIVMIVSAIALLGSIGGFVETREALGTIPHVTVADLAAGTVDAKYVTVTCDEQKPLGKVDGARDGFACFEGDRALIVTLRTSDTRGLDREISGTLDWQPGARTIHQDGLEVVNAFFEANTVGTARTEATTALVFLIGSLSVLCLTAAMTLRARRRPPSSAGGLTPAA